MGLNRRGRGWLSFADFIHRPVPPIFPIMLRQDGLPFQEPAMMVIA